MGVFDRIFDPLVIAARQGQQKRWDQFQPAAEMVQFVDFGKRSKRANRDTGRIDLQTLQSSDLFPTQRALAADIHGERQHLGANLLAQVTRALQEFVVAPLLTRLQRLDSLGHVKLP